MRNHFISNAQTLILTNELAFVLGREKLHLSHLRQFSNLEQAQFSSLIQRH